MTRNDIETSELTFPPEPSSVGAARRFVVGAVGPTDADLSTNLALLVSELATNAVLHAKTQFTVKVSRSADFVRVEVSDGNSRLPRRRRFGPGAVTGRGLMLVEKQSRRWSAELTPEGKTVWFELALQAVS